MHRTEYYTSLRLPGPGPGRVRRVKLDSEFTGTVTVTVTGEVLPTEDALARTSPPSPTRHWLRQYLRCRSDFAHTLAPTT